MMNVLGNTSRWADYKQLGVTETGSKLNKPKPMGITVAMSRRS